ncbi:MAG: PAS domain S-box protein [Acidobacteria bacterium]|nr:PAS domain S-box protein [Acidobacteriota bacterium]
MPDKADQLRRENARLNKELQIARNRFDRIFHTSSNLMAIFRISDGSCIDMNQAIADFGGFDREELIGSSSMVHSLWADPAQRDWIIQKIGEEGSIYNLEVDFLRKDGKVRRVLFSANPILFDDEPCLLSTSVDITERKQTETALRESEERFQLITNTIDEIFYIYDAQKGIATYLSPAFERVWGYARDRALNQDEPFINPVHPEDREKVMNWGPMTRTGQPVSYEYRIIRADGSIRHIWDRGYPVAQKDGKVTLYVGTGLDVTEWRQAEEALRESREYLDQIINGIADPVVVKDCNHIHVLVNDAFCKYMEQKKEDLIGKTGFEDLPEELAKALLKSEEEVLRTGRNSLTEDSIIDPHGLRRTWMTRKSLLTNKKGEKQIILAMRDITEYKQLEAQLLQAQKMEAIGVLAGGVAHDFNNLLNVINGYSELALESLGEDAAVRKDIEQVWDAGKRAAALTSQLLAFGRKQILQPEILDLNAIIDQLSAMLRRLIGEDIDLAFITSQDLGMIHADPAKIQQVVLNLAVNARDAMPKGGKLTIETANIHFNEDYIREHSGAKPGAYVMLAISDNGVGMDAGTKEHLFEPFFTTKEKNKGTGLGLATVYGIVKQSNGFIWVYSEPGKGTTFKIYFPRVEGESTSIEITEEPEYPGTETILLVEDEAAVRNLASRILRDRGYTIIEAGDGKEALRLAGEYTEEIHLVVTDVIMPGISGSVLVSRLETTRPGIKALYISGYTDNAIVHHGILDSGIAFLEKPFSPKRLASKVREALQSPPKKESRESG